MDNKNFLQKTIDYGLLLTLLVFPFLFKIALISLTDVGHPLIEINFSMADLIIGFILILWILKLAIYNEWKQIKFPPIPVLLFIGTGILSFVNAFSIGQWVKEIIQLSEYFFLFYLLLINNFRTFGPTAIKNTLFFTTSIMLITAFIQYSAGKSDPFLVKGISENRNTLGMFLCMIIPLVYSELLASNKLSKKIWMALILLLVCVVLLSVSAIFAISISLFIMNWLFNKRLFQKFLIGIILLGVAYILIFPQKNKNAIKDFTSIYEQGKISENYYRSTNAASYFNNNQFLFKFKKSIKGNYLYIFTNKLFLFQIPNTLSGDRYEDIDNEKHIKNRYLNMVAALNLIFDHPVFGCGLGNYQDFISKYFIGFPKINTAEPTQENTYLIVGSTTGIIGLAALLYLLFSRLKLTYGIYRRFPENSIRLFHLGLFGSLIAIMINSFFVYLFSASVIVPFILILYFSSSYYQSDKAF